MQDAAIVSGQNNLPLAVHQGTCLLLLLLLLLTSQDADDCGAGGWV
jgi:hypothetical protein